MSELQNSKSNNTFLGHLGTTFVSTHGLLSTVLAIIGFIFTFFSVSESSTMSSRAVVFTLIILLNLLAFFIHAAYTAFYKEAKILPSVKLAQAPPTSHESSVALLLLSPSELFSFDTAVSIYLMQDEMEILIGYGRVLNIQEDRKIQVLVMRTLTDPQQWENIKQSNATLLKQLRVKPTVPTSVMESFHA